MIAYIFLYFFQLNFTGVTVDPSRRYIHFSTDKHMFTPVPISDTSSPLQVYELYNGGALPVKYEFNTVPLHILRNVSSDLSYTRENVYFVYLSSVCLWAICSEAWPAYMSSGLLSKYEFNTVPLHMLRNVNSDFCFQQAYLT